MLTPYPRSRFFPTPPLGVVTSRVQQLERLVADGRQPVLAARVPERLEGLRRMASLEQQEEAVAVLAHDRQRGAGQQPVRGLEDAQVGGQPGRRGDARGPRAHERE